MVMPFYIGTVAMYREIRKVAQPQRESARLNEYKILTNPNFSLAGF
jgi:hypothetical protein